MKHPQKKTADFKRIDALRQYVVKNKHSELTPIEKTRQDLLMAIDLINKAMAEPGAKNYISTKEMIDLSELMATYSINSLNDARQKLAELEQKQQNIALGLSHEQRVQQLVYRSMKESVGQKSA